MKILYVENHAVFAESVKGQFLQQHWVTIVPSLSAAREAMLGDTFDVLLVDYDLDDGKGDALVQSLSATQGSPPVIGVSSHDEGNGALVRAGAAAVCNKMSLERIQSVIDSVMQDKARHDLERQQ